MKISVIGDGGWGTANAILLAGYGHAITVWGAFADYIEEIKAKGENTRFLKGVPLPPSIKWTADAQEAVAGAEIVVLASPSKFLADVCARFKGLVDRRTLVVSLVKGLSEDSHRRMSEIAKEILGVDDVVVLSGPTHAEEVSRGVPTTIVAAAENPAAAKKVQEIWSGRTLRVYTSDDPVGVEVGGAVKNVIAVAVGASDGLGFGDNTRAALITRGLAEVARFAKAYGAKPQTVYGLSGVGDLIVTCTSRHSRNHSVGERLGKGEKMAEILSSMKMVAEGVWNAKVIHRLAQDLGVEMPITETVYKVCHEDFPASAAIESLMGRELKSE
ncbi:MAG: NAD(P)-dependent glycerol-3-phosphate dehydrogenase [Kiritimatiellae bacterium]|nr:NAD(P)-dependent glycerol-3-phosphate dehydrogenase [Kiritimatiellia bacterium]